MRCVITIRTILEISKWDRETLNNLPKVTELVITRAWFQIPGRSDFKEYSIKHRSILLENGQLGIHPSCLLTPEPYFYPILYNALLVCYFVHKNNTKQYIIET